MGARMEKDKKHELVSDSDLDALSMGESEADTKQLIVRPEMRPMELGTNEVRYFFKNKWVIEEFKKYLRVNCGFAPTSKQKRDTYFIWCKANGQMAQIVYKDLSPEMVKVIKPTLDDDFHPKYS